MRSGRLMCSGLGAVLVVSAALLSGCGGGEDEGPRDEDPATPALAPAGVIDRDPYAISCGHVRDQMRWDRVTRRATVAIADRERFRDLSLLQATQSLFFAMTEICKGRPASYEPAEAAVQATRQGKYRADLGTP